MSGNPAWSLALATVLAGSPQVSSVEPASAADEQPASTSAGEPDLAKLAVQAQAAFDAGDYDRVVELAKAAYAASGAVTFLYAQAHAERFRGNCREALGLYGRVIAAEPDGPLASVSREGIQLCEAEARDVDAPPVAVPEAAPPPAGNAPQTSVEALVRDVPDGPHEPAARRPDTLGTVLLATGTIGAVTGLGLLASGSAVAGRAERAEDEDAFVDSRRRAQGLMIAGGIVSGVAVALLAGSVARFATVRRSRSVAIQLRPEFAGIAVRTRF